MGKDWEDKIEVDTRNRALLLLVAITIAIMMSARLHAATGTCGGASITIPFTDVSSSSVFFCSIAEAYFSGLTNGTTATTYSPSDPVPREQMAAFITRTLDQSLKRGSRRAALNQWWTAQALSGEMLSGAGMSVNDVVCDGWDLWAFANDGVTRVRASDGGFVDHFNLAAANTGVVAAGAIYCAGGSTLWKISLFGASVVSSDFSPTLTCITFDGSYVWTGSDTGVIGKTFVSSQQVTTASTSFGALRGMLFDGANVWVTESGVVAGRLRRLDSNGGITLTVTTGIDPRRPVFDGTNIWVPNKVSNSVIVVRASTGAVIATLTGNGLSGPTAAAFDGQRIMVTNTDGVSVSLWKADDLTPLGSVSIITGRPPVGVASDGVNFWVATPDPNSSNLVRF